MARWKNISRHGWTGPIDFKGHEWSVALDEVVEIPDEVTPWIVSRQYPLERVDIPTIESVVEAAPAAVAPAAKATPAAPASPVTISDGDGSATGDGAPQKTPVDRRGARAKATPAGG